MSKKDEVVSTYLEGEKLPNFKSLSGIEYREYYGEQNNMGHVKLIMGGVIPPDDVEVLKPRGVHAVFTPGTRQDALLNTIKSII